MLHQFFILCIFKQIAYANILGFAVLPLVSHKVVIQPIWKTLSLKGHKTTVLSPNPIKNASLYNLTEIDLSFIQKIAEKYDVLQSMQSDLPDTTIIKNMHKHIEKFVLAELNSSSFQALANDKKAHFDIVLAQFLFPTTYALSVKFNCPLIGIITCDAFTTAYDAVGNPSHPIINPDSFFLPVKGDLKFWDILRSVFLAVWFRLYHLHSILPTQDVVAKHYISKELPYLGDIEKNVSMLFVNTNPIFNNIRPNVPAVIQFGGINVNTKKELPADLQKELDEATQGVVYFSMGSNVKSVNINQRLRDEIVQALSELPYKVLWKWEADFLPNKPKNVITRKWFPQVDILGHKNVKVFVTQGGLQSMEQAIFNGVPLVAIPFYADQPTNAGRMSKLGFAKVVYPSTLTKEQLKQAIIEVAENDKYHKAIKEVCKLILDVPITGLEQVTWWTDYVIRHKGARHLRSTAIDMPLYQYFLVDVISVLAISLILFGFITYKIAKVTMCLLMKGIK